MTGNQDSRTCRQRWGTFCQHIIDLAEALGTQLVVTMGALLADVPHSHPVSITGLASDADLLSRFSQETRTTARLNHPNILAVYDVGAHDGVPFVVSELL